jgi:hypothetical protein
LRALLSSDSVTAAHTGVLLVEPAAFGFNAETAATNRFQQAAGISPHAAKDAAQREFAGLVTALREAGVPVAVAADTSEPVKPDAVFPNNWVSFHADGTVVLYPMLNPSRRAERREAVIDAAKAQLGFHEGRRMDLTAHERSGQFLEGTGSLVLDHRARVAYASRSPRTDEALVRDWARALGYEAFLFDATTPDGTPVYHTNVLLWIGEKVAGLGLDWVARDQRAALEAKLRAAGHELLLLDDAQLRAFAGNMLEVQGATGRRLVMSAAAHAALRSEQLALLASTGTVPLVAAIPTIERLGGGSVRCMLAEVPLTGRSAG